MTYPPLPGNITIPAVIPGNVLQSDDTSVSVNDVGFESNIVMKTNNIIALIVDEDQKISINTEASESRLTINNDSSTTSTLRLSYLDSFYFDSRITSNGNVLMIPSCDNLVLDPDLTTSIKKNFDITDHNGSTIGLKLNGGLVTASAVELNYLDNPAGVAAPFKALVLNGSSNVSGINHLSSNILTGVLTSGPQPYITEIDTLNITTQLSIAGAPFNITPASLDYLDITTPGIAEGLKSLVFDVGRNISNINSLSASSLSGILTTGPQPNITSLSSLGSLNVNGLSTFGDKITITNATGQVLRLAYNNTNYTNLNVSSLGELIINSTGGLVSIDNGTNFKISSHNGSSNGLILGNQLVIATGTQLNYIAVSPGTAVASRALVLDASKNVLGANIIGATSLSGTLLTGLQPNIISVNVLDIANHNGNTTGLSLAGTLITATALKINYIDTTPGSAQASKALVLDSARNITNINNLSASNLSGVIQTSTQPNINIVNTLRISNHDGLTEGLMLGAVLVTATAEELNYNNVNPGVGTAMKSLVLDSNGSIFNINNITANTFTGTLITTSQPNITTVNTLDIQNHNGISTGLSLSGVLITSSAVQINRINVSPGVATALRAVVLDSNKTITGLNTVSAAILGGVLSTSSQVNIRLLQSINIEDHNGSTTGLSLGGTLITATADQLNRLVVNPGNALALKALVLDGSGEISGITTISSSNIFGTVKTVNQPFIQAVNILNISNHDGSTIGLSLGGTLITATANQINKINVSDGIAAASKALVLNSSSNITGINNLGATTLTGILNTAAQPNITTVNVLNISNHNGLSIGLSLGGTLVTATAAQINRINTSAGAAIANKAVVLDSNLDFIGVNNFSTTTISGTMLTAAQPNINSVSTLNITGHDGGSNGLRLGGVLVVSTANQLNYTSVTPGTATSGRALVTNVANSISNINVLTATKLVASQLSLSGIISNFNTGGVIIKTYSMINLVGRLIDMQLLPTLNFQNFQPADLTNNFSCEIIGYILPAYSETYTFFVLCNDRVRLWVNDVLLLHSWVSLGGYRTSASIFLNAGQWVKIYIQYQIDSVSSTLFNVQWSSPSNGLTNIPSSSLAWDNNPPSNSSNHFSQNSLTIYNTSTSAANLTTMTVDTSGDLIIDASGNNITLGTADSFNIPSHNGLSAGLYLGGSLVQTTAFELNYLKVNLGIATASKALILDASKSITGITSLSSTSLSCVNLSADNFTISDLTLSGPLNNFNTGELLIRQFTGPDVSGRLVDVDVITDINLNEYDPIGLISNYSLDIIGYIKPTYTEPYTFYAIAASRARIWVNNVLVLNIWDTNTGLEYTSNSIELTADLWVPIYIQYQNITDTQKLVVKWSSITLIKSFIPLNSMAWDNTSFDVPRRLSVSDSITVFSSQSGLLTPRSGGMTIDSTGNLLLSTASQTVSVATNNSLNIITHNGTSKGLYLSGTLVTATATELNRVGGVVPGTTLANKAIILDGSKAVSGLTSITSDELYGVIKTPAQPFITSFGTLNNTLTINSDIVLGPTTLFRLNTNSTTALISSSSTNTLDSSADLFIGNYGTTPSTSSRKFIIKASGLVGIQTSVPVRTLSINGGGSAYSMRLINNNNNGTETNYTDFGTDSSGVLNIATSGTKINILSNLSIGSSSPANLNVSSGVLNITSNSGCVQIGNTTNTTMPLEVGSTSFVLTGTVGFLNSDGSTGKFNTPPSNYSIRTTSSVIVNGTICITSDRRLKENINDLDIDICKKFILESNPVSFTYKTDKNKKRFGLIAQDVIRSDFKELVQFTPDNIESSIENDIESPANLSMNVSYTEIIPILISTIKDLYKKNNELETKIQEIYKRL